MHRKIPMYYHINSLLHVSALQKLHLQGVQNEPAELLPNVVKAKWMRAVYCDCCEMLWDEGCIL
jgi:hypothetical protein